MTESKIGSMFRNETCVTTDLTVITGTGHTGTDLTEAGIEQCGNPFDDQINRFSF